MKKIVIFIATIFALSVGAAAQAGSYFISGDIGQAQSNYTGMVRSNDTSVQLGVGYQYNKNIGVEANYNDLGRIVQVGVSGNSFAYNISGVGTVAVNNKFGLYAKLGYGTATTKSSFGTKANRSDFLYGLGATYSYNDNVDFRASWTKIPLGNGVTMNKGADNIYSLGAVYKFN